MFSNKVDLMETLISWVICRTLILLLRYSIVGTTISNSNWIEWSTIQGVIARVISDLKLRARLLLELYDTSSKY